MKGRPNKIPVRDWRVVGGLLWDSADQILLVANRRYGGRLEWTPPGGVVDAGEEPLAALRRELLEETGLEASDWFGPCYRVGVDFPERSMTLAVEVYETRSYTGSIVLNDPDGIVEDARFVEADEARELLTTAPPWVRDPVESRLVSNSLSGEAPQAREELFLFVANGIEPSSLVVKRLNLGN